LKRIFSIFHLFYYLAVQDKVSGTYTRSFVFKEWTDVFGGKYWFC